MNRKRILLITLLLMGLLSSTAYCGTAHEGIFPNESGVYCGGSPFDPYFYSDTPFDYFVLGVTSIPDKITDTKQLDYSLKRIKQRGKKTIVNIHFFASGAEFSNPLPLTEYQKRIDAIMDNVDVSNVDIVCLSEKTNVRAFPQSGLVLEGLYDYCKKKWPRLLVYQWFEGVPENIHNKADGYFTRCSTTDESGFVKMLQPYLDTGKPVLNLLTARLNRGWSHKKLQAIHDKAALHKKYGASIHWFSLDNQTYVIDPETNTRRINENRWAWTSTDPLMQKLWRMVQEKTRELRGESYDPAIYTMMQQATDEYVKSWDTKYQHISKPTIAKQLLSEDFNSTATELPWSFEGKPGTITIKDNALYLGGASGYKFLMLPEKLSDFSLKLDIKYITPTAPLGICFAYSSPKNYRSARFMPRDIYEYCYVDQLADGKWITPADWVPLKMETDKWYHIELIRKGTTTYVYLDGVLRIYTTDDPDIIQKGRRIGLIHYSGSIAFDNLKLAELK